LGTLYVFLLLSTFLNLLWRPHRLLRQRREQLLKPLANAFDAAIVAAQPPRADGKDRLKTHADDLAEISMQFKLLDEASPVWPLHVRQLRPILVTAVLPVAIPVVSALISKFFIG
jgi:hypothetical protein